MAEPNTKAWLKPFLKPLKPTFREVLGMSAFVNMVALAVPVFTMQVYDRVVFHAGISTLWGLVIGMVIVIAFDLVLKLARSRVMQTVALRVDVLVGRQLFNKLMALPLSELETKPASHWQSLFRDVDTVRNTVSGASAVLITDLPFVFMFGALIIAIAPSVAWVLAITVPLFMWVAWRSGNVMAQANQAERQSMVSRDALIGEMIQGRTTIKALALDRAMRPEWEQRHAENITQSMQRGGKTDLYSNMSGSLTMATTVLITTVGAVAIINQELTMGALIAANMLSGRLLGPMNQLVQQWRTYNSFKQSVNRLGETFLTESEREESEISLQAPRGELQVENVLFSYSPELKPVLHNVTVKLNAGGIHALVGRNGSGKTTLLKILQGLYRPTSGRILIDDADIAQFTRSELADWMGYVPQECVLFAGTVRDNIAHRKPEATDAEVIKAATAAGVHQFIIDLPDGYASDIGEAGRRLSGGQRQRIAIARALMGDPAVLMMDEPSANLDRQAEQALRETLKKISKTRSVIIVTHSPILLAACDDLVALDQGRIALAGPSKEILPRLFGQNPLQDADGASDAENTPKAKSPQPAAAKQRPKGQKPKPQDADTSLPPLKLGPEAVSTAPLPADQQTAVQSTPQSTAKPRGQSTAAARATKARAKAAPTRAAAGEAPVGEATTDTDVLAQAAKAAAGTPAQPAGGQQAKRAEPAAPKRTATQAKPNGGDDNGTAKGKGNGKSNGNGRGNGARTAPVAAAPAADASLGEDPYADALKTLMPKKPAAAISGSGKGNR